MELFNALGLDVRIFLAQFINFAVLVFVLYRFVYKPIFALLEKRKRIIEEGLRKSKEAQEQLNIAKEKSEAIIKEAKKEAKGIAEKAMQSAQEQKEELISQAKHDVLGMIERAEKEIEQKKSLIIEEVRADVASMVVRSVEKILHSDVSQDSREKFMGEAVRILEKEKQSL